MTVTPIYTGTARVLIEAPPVNTANPLQPTTNAVADGEKVESEVQILLSPALAEKAIATLALDQNADFNSAESNVFSSLFGRPGAGASPQAILEKFEERLNVFQVGTSRVIAIEFSSESPALAQSAANRIAELYLEDQRQTRLDINQRSEEWLSQEIAGLRARLFASEARVEAFRAEKGLLEGAASELQVQELTELNSQFTAARALRVEAEARITAIEQLGAANQLAGGGIESADAVLQSGLIQDLRTSEVQLTRELSQLSAQLLPTHPTMVQKDAELRDLQFQIQSEVQKVIASVQNEAILARAREQSVEAQLNQLKARRTISNQDQITLRELERDASADRGLLEILLARLAEVSALGEISIQDANARIISPSGLPSDPSFPNKKALLGLGGLISLFAGIFAVILAEMTDRRIRFAGDIERSTGLNVVAVTPHINANPEDELIFNPSGAYAQSVLALQAGLGTSLTEDGRGKNIAVTSTRRGEGRTSTAISLARSMAQTGFRVLLIDGDFERPCLGDLFNIGHNPGFSDLVAGRVHYRRAIFRDRNSNAHVMAAGRCSPSVLSSPRTKKILNWFARHYHAIIIDCAPMSERDASQNLVLLADQCVYAVNGRGAQHDKVVMGLQRASLADFPSGIAMVVTQGKA